MIKRDLSVRETEKLAKREPEKPAANNVTRLKDADTRQIEKDLSAALGMRISIDHKPGGESGTLTVKYKDLEQLDEVCRRLSATLDAGKV